MLDMIRKAMLAGIGVVDIAKERVEKIADELVKRGEMTEWEKAKFVREMTNKMVGETERLKKKIDESVERAVSKVRGAKEEEIARKDQEIARLNEQVQQLRERLEKLEKKEVASDS